MDKLDEDDDVTGAEKEFKQIFRETKQRRSKKGYIGLRFQRNQFVSLLKLLSFSQIIIILCFND